MTAWADQIARLAEGAARGIRPEPPLTVSEWADARRVLPSTSAMPGRWRTDQTPYLRELQDAMADQTLECVVAMVGSQLGKSEGMVNAILRSIDVAPGPLLLVQPTVETAANFVRDRIDPAIEATPRIAQLVSAPRGRDGTNNAETKSFPGGFLRIIGSNAPAKLASTPIRDVYIDEIDRCASDVGGEGSLLGLVRARQSTFATRKLVLVSTPTVRGVSVIEAEYASTDRRQYHVPCPHCQAMQVLRWRPTAEHPGGVVWQTGQPETAAYQCEHCGSLIDEGCKTQMLARGRWIASAQGADPRRRGYHLSSLYSPLGWLSWRDLAREWEQAQGDPLKLQSFLNTRLAESWEADGGSGGIDVSTLRARGERWRSQVPQGVLHLTAGVDVQDDRLEVEVVGWGAAWESWSVAYEVLMGDPSTPALWARLADLLSRGWIGDDGRTHRIAAAAIDSGGHYTEQVYRFSLTHARQRWWAIKGADQGPGWPRARPKRPTKGKGAALYMVGVSGLKDAVYARLRIAAAGPGYMHVPDDRPEAWWSGLTAEVCKIIRHGTQNRRVWVLPSGRRNEPLDCRVYATAAMLGLERSIGRTLPDALQALAQPAPVVQTEARPVPPRPAPTAPAAPTARPARPERRPRLYDAYR